MKTLIDYISGAKYKNVEILQNADDLPRDSYFVTSLLDNKSMERFAIYKDSNNFYYAISEDD